VAVKEDTLETEGDFEVTDDRAEVRVGFNAWGPRTNGEFIKTQRNGGGSGSDSNSHESIGRDIVEGDVIVVVEESELPGLGGESGIQFIGRGEVVVVVDAPGGAVSGTGIHVESEHSHVLQIDLVERELVQEISIEASVGGVQRHIGIFVVVVEILSGAIERGEISSERTSGRGEGGGNDSSSGSHQGIELSSDITIRESTGIDLEVALAGIVVQVADGGQVH